MTKRQTPPGRKSKLCAVVVKPFGPHHCARCFGSVKATNTRSRGASNSRMPMIERGSLSISRLCFAAMSTLLGTNLGLTNFRAGRLAGLLGRLPGLQRFQVAVEALEALVVKAAIV